MTHQIMDIAEANELITSYLNSSPYPTILGLLPLSAEEEKQVTQCTLAELAKWDGVDDITAIKYQLFYGAPAATAYTLINAASKAIQAGTNNLFWEPFGNLLSIQIPSTSRSEFSKNFAKSCNPMPARFTMFMLLRSSPKRESSTPMWSRWRKRSNPA